MIRGLWIAGGFVALALGALGAVLPLLPTTPFVLLAAFCFMRGSKRLHGWLSRHAYFGPIIGDWEASGAIAPRYKRVAVATIVLTFGISVALGLAPWILLAQGLVLAGAATFILTRPNPVIGKRTGLAPAPVQARDAA